MKRATSYLTGKPNVRRPGDVSRVAGPFLREWIKGVDAWSRSLLESYIPKVAACGSGFAADERRGWMLVDWFCRVYTPAWLREAGFAAGVAAIEATAAIVDFASAEAVIPGLLAATPVTDVIVAPIDREVFGMGWGEQPEAWSMGYRAWKRVCDVANDAIWASGGEAAYEAMGWEVERVRVVAAGVMQHATLIATARAGSEVAGNGWRGTTVTVAPAVAYATAALRPTVIALQQSGLELLDRMIADRGE